MCAPNIHITEAKCMNFSQRGKDTLHDVKLFSISSSDISLVNDSQDGGPEELQLISVRRAL